MSNRTLKSTSTVKKTVQEDVDNTGAVENMENEKLKQENEELKKMLSELTEKIDNLSSNKNNEISEVSEEYPEPDANKQIKLISMFYGVLNLCNNSNRSAGRILTFSKFGEVKSVLYHDLVDYVNNERRFAEAGYFYILDKASVYHLGLTSEYEHLVDGDIVNHLMDYSVDELDSIVSIMTDVQKQSIADLFSDKLYHGNVMDLNKISIISKYLPVSIEQMVQEKKDFDERAKKSIEN